jgi:hypothetical protein
MSRIEGLSRVESPFLDRGGTMAFLGEDERPRVHADAATLRLIADELLRIARQDYGRHFEHARLQELRGRVDHLVAVYVCGYRYAEDGHPDAGRSFTWETDLGSYSGPEMCRRWCEDFEVAVGLAAFKCPDLRLDLRFGGRNRGLRRARFSRSHSVPALAGAAIALPDPMPAFFRHSPAAAVTYVLLQALAMEKEHGHPYPAALRRAA